MELGVAILALSLGLAAIVIAIASDVRTRRATREIARELVQLRDRLLRYERESDGGGDAGSRADDAAELVEAMSARIETLEERLRGALERRVPLSVDADGSDTPELGDHVVAGLRRRGYQRVAVLDVREDGSVLVEAERDGIVAKGLARVGEDGAVELASVSSVRAFP